MSSKTAVHHHRTKRKTKTKTKEIKFVVLKLLEVMAVASLIVVILQFIYPRNLTLPFTKISGMSVGFKTSASIEKTLNWFGSNAEVTLITPNKEWTEKWHSIGVGIDRQTTIKKATSYSNWERLIPFSGITKAMQNRELSVVTLIDEQRLSNFAEKIASEEEKSVSGIDIKIVNNEAKVIFEEAGYSYSTKEIKEQIKSLSVKINDQVYLEPTLNYSTENAEELAEAANEILNSNFVVKVGDRIFPTTIQTRSNWLEFKESGGELELDYSRSSIREFVQSINDKIAITPGNTIVNRLDGREVSRSVGEGGKEIEVNNATNTIVDHLKNGTSLEVELYLLNVEPKIEYKDEYTKTNAGLQAIIEDWERTTYGDYGIIVRELGGEGRYAEWQPEKKFVTASTFKIFVYYAVAKKIEWRQISYSDITDMGWTVEDCLEEMIVNSTNPCAISLTNLVGWQESQRLVEEAGFHDTWINNSAGGDKYSSVKDETNFMHRLHDGTLMAQESNERLLGYLKRQIWRGGIPSGVPYGVTVADKVGFYNGWVHDVAIVYSPSGTYLLGIMSKGGSDPVFANLSARIYSFFN